jgi:uncharacterized protein YijF (DUF1287 family)
MTKLMFSVSMDGMASARAKFGIAMLLGSAMLLAAQQSRTFSSLFNSTTERPPLEEIASPQIRKLLASANEQLTVTKGYTSAYVGLEYPNGDLPQDTGACADVIVRAFRANGVDLQKEIHEDMAANFLEYPNKWGNKRTDKNIDHRRVPNIQMFLKRKGKSVRVTKSAGDYQPGDVVAWDLNGNGLTHIGLVSNVFNSHTQRYSIVHNIGGGVQLEDRIFDWKIIGHYRYF